MSHKQIKIYLTTGTVLEGPCNYEELIKYMTATSWFCSDEQFINLIGQEKSHYINKNHIVFIEGIK